MPLKLFLDLFIESVVRALFPVDEGDAPALVCVVVVVVVVVKEAVGAGLLVMDPGVVLMLSIDSLCLECCM